jgi:NAD(P)H-hydrate epimerase
MRNFDPKNLQKLYRSPLDSHKGQNGKLLVIGGSELFHAASMWSLEVASRIVDMVFYASVPVNEAIVKIQKERFHDGIVVPEREVEEYLDEADCVLIGPGMERRKETKTKTNYLLKKYPTKKWVVDGGALQMMDKNLLTNTMIVTPHAREFKKLFRIAGGKASAQQMAKKYGCTIVLKGPIDVICDQKQGVANHTGNEGMTKGGTGDVLAGLIAALYCQNDAFLAASAGTYLNGLAGDRLYALVGPYFNASDLVHEIPKVMAEVLE